MHIILQINKFNGGYIVKRLVSILLCMIMAISIIAITPISAAESDLVETSSQSMSGNFYTSYTLTGNGAIDMVNIAKAQNERNQNSMGYTENWCADFVSDCAKLAGQSSAVPFNGTANGMYTAVINAGGSCVSSAQAGDLVFFTNNGYSYGHVGIALDSSSNISGNIFYRGTSPSKVCILKNSSEGFSSWIYVRPNYKSNIHTHNYNTHSHYGSEHPHYQYLKCSCGATQINTSKTALNDSCDLCYPGKPVVIVHAGTDMEYTYFDWGATKTTDGYELKILNRNKSQLLYHFTGISTESFQVKLPAGEYVVVPISVKDSLRDTDRWWTEGDAVLFTVAKGDFRPVAETELDGRRYELYDIAMPWTEAKAKCEELGGHLVTITSQNEQNTVRDLISQGRKYSYWMGMTDEAAEGVWVNITGEPVSYTNWSKLEPNNGSDLEHYGVIRNVDGNNWNDVSNTYSAVGFVCEYEKNTENIDFTMDGGEGFVSVSWSQIPSAVKYEFSVTDEQGNVINLESSETSIEWNPDEDNFLYKDIYIKVKAYDSSGDLIGESPVWVYEIYDVLADWWGEYGDADFNGKVAIQDATTIQKYLAGIMEFSGAAIHVADVDGDSILSIRDATAIQKYLAEIPSDSCVGESCFYGCQIFEVMKKQQTESDWVLASSVPKNAEITDRKYTYTLTETTSSTSSAMSGWTKTGSNWKQTAQGTHKYASYPGGFSASHSLYTKFDKSALTAYENATSKRTVTSPSVSTYIYWHWCRGNDSLGCNHNRSVSEYQTSTYSTFDAFESDTDISYNSSAQAYKYVNTGCCGDSYWWNRTTVYQQTYKDYQMYYTYEKKSNLESSTTPTGNNVSNVQEWVKYICYE